MELLVLKLYQHASCSLISEKAYGKVMIDNMTALADINHMGTSRWHSGMSSQNQFGSGALKETFGSQHFIFQA